MVEPRRTPTAGRRYAGALRIGNGAAALQAVAVGLAAVALATAPASASWVPPRFVIGGYQIGDARDAARLVRLNDAGLDFVVNSDQGTPGLARQFVARLESLRVHRPGFRLKGIVYEERGFSPAALFKNADPLANRESVRSALRPGGGLNNPSVMGWMIWDEPPMFYPPRYQMPADRVFGSLYEMTRLIRDEPAASDKLAYVNLGPLHGFAYAAGCRDRDTLAAYRCYLDRYLSHFDRERNPAPVLSIDSFPFETPNADFRRYFHQLAITRDQALQHSRSNYRIPFWSVIQAAPRRETASSPYRPTPTFRQIRWQAYVSLAYGARGILYWTTQPWQNADPRMPGYGASFLESDGTPGLLYDSLRVLNAELRAVGEVLADLDPITVQHAAANRFALPPRAARGRSRLPARVASIRMKGVQGMPDHGMVAWFADPRRKADMLLVVNKDTMRARSFGIALGGAAATIERLDARRRAWVRVAAGARSFATPAIAPGGGALFRVANDRRTRGRVAGRPRPPLGPIPGPWGPRAPRADSVDLLNGNA